MNRRAFTLVEVMVSIALFGLITLLLFGTIDNLRIQLSFFKEKEKSIHEKNRILSLMRTDFDRAKAFSISKNETKEFTIASIKGSNRSLYTIEQPNVVWIVLKNDNTLVRLESASPITLPLTPKSLYLVHSDLIGKGCELFRIYESDKRRLIYVKFENQSPLVVETMK
jgi:prepilin-type N-terminal cleavage/methylation domain-containing protein